VCEVTFLLCSAESRANNYLKEACGERSQVRLGEVEPGCETIKIIFYVIILTMVINDIVTERFVFNNWIRDSRGFYNAISKMTIAGRVMTQVLLTLEDPDSERINANLQAITDSLMESIEYVDSDGDDFRIGTLLEMPSKKTSFINRDHGTIPYTLMFFDYVV
jgi:hypothetical protein